MKSRHLLSWFSLLCIILMIFGLVYAFFGLQILPIDKGTLLPWESALYGAIMIGWSVTLFLVGRIAFHRNDHALKRALLYGLLVWLVIEGLFSAYLGVWFNVGVDAAVLALFSFPLTKVIRDPEP